MISGRDSLEQQRLGLKVLIHQHRKTKRWFWRTGMASLVGACLWLATYFFASGEADIIETLAITIGAFIMWVLFLWAFWLLKKLRTITSKVWKAEKQLRQAISRSIIRNEN